MLADPAFVVPPVPRVESPVGIAWLRSHVGRFSSGAEHERRRALAVAEIDRLEPDELRRDARDRAAAALRDGDSLRHVPVETLAAALGLPAGLAARRRSGRARVPAARRGRHRSGGCRGRAPRRGLRRNRRRADSRAHRAARPGLRRHRRAGRARRSRHAGARGRDGRRDPRRRAAGRPARARDPAPRGDACPHRLPGGAAGDDRHAGPDRRRRRPPAVRLRPPPLPRSRTRPRDRSRVCHGQRARPRAPANLIESCDRLRPCMDADLGECVLEVRANRARRDEQRRRNLAVRHAIAYAGEHCELTRGEAERALALVHGLASAIGRMKEGRMSLRRIRSRSPQVRGESSARSTLKCPLHRRACRSERDCCLGRDVHDAAPLVVDRGTPPGCVHV